MKPYSLISAVCMTLSLTAVSTIATAQSANSFFGVQDGLFAISEKRERTFIDVGVAYVNRNPYVGSEETENLILPYARGDYKGRLFINAATGAGVYWRNTDNIRFSTSINWATGRDGEDTTFLGEEGDVDGSVTVVNALRYYLPFAAFDAISSVPLTGDFDGARFDTLVSTEFYPIKGLRVTPGVRATFGTDGWVNTLYGLQAETLSTAGITDIDPFETDGGLMMFGVHTAAYYDLPHKFELICVANYSFLQNDAKDSPLSPDNDGLTLTLSLARQF